MYRHFHLSAVSTAVGGHAADEFPFAAEYADHAGIGFFVTRESIGGLSKGGPGKNAFFQLRRLHAAGLI